MGGAKRILQTSLGIGATLLVATGCANDRGPHPNLPPLGVLADFTSRNLCGLGVSPEILLGNVPQNVATYRIRISDISTLRGIRWQADLPARGPSIPEAMLDGFDLPCPGDTQILAYRIEVLALAADNRPLAYGWNFSTVLSLPEQLDRERQDAKRGGQPRATAPLGRPSFFIQ